MLLYIPLATKQKKITNELLSKSRKHIKSMQVTVDRKHYTRQIVNNKKKNQRYLNKINYLWA